MGEERYDLAVLGAGPGGYVAAIRAAQLGLKVVVVEKDQLGGVCLNWGCIPTKAILRSAQVYDEVVRCGREHGIAVSALHFDYGQVVARSRQVVERLKKGVAALFKKNHVRCVYGEGRLRAADCVEVGGEAGRVQLFADHIVLATGSRERTLPGLPIDGERVLNSRCALAYPRVPESVIVIGGGPIGVEFAWAWACFGAHVTIVEMEETLLPGSEPEIVAELQRQLRRRGVVTMLNSRLASSHCDGERVRVEVVGSDGKLARADAERALVAVGRVASLEGIGIAELGIRTKGGFVVVDDELRTSIPTIFAVGDMVGPPLLAHKASAEGVAAVENIVNGGGHRIDRLCVPVCVYCQPEVASVGLTEREARNRGFKVNAATFPFRALGKAVAAGHPDGLVKIVTDGKNGNLLGCHIVGAGATELIAEATLALRLRVRAEALADTIHAHPTLSEAVMEAALAVEGQAIHS